MAALRVLLHRCSTYPLPGRQTPGDRNVLAATRFTATTRFAQKSAVE
ncbi:hypothetical protein LI99_32215 [Mycolicibacterium smegmatis]|uniref:Uncharacterized protein n=1 Tax=Mycolicibacterium smegmatis (strain ATCC 700084 / mc(2)155) TaxID=246196 RepID=A0R6E1_MYCS2|nr:hypothetical protein MSMEG_6517 [Mycolicibacterium smegmatis MC2 155]AIU18117.1 hypothetical protein LI99_32215 [Mycolicibacterium smegmatis]AIU11491.1 hypothetical protein LJ00_32210 [Mycolicibacterium smegmatis MC2 155]AIU24739.1 hypothetical protein LI98_32220 [Mycolicibacterium smegmatis]TBH30325.1 hypothetical protein EYS45_26705 [Mycolicibacterium smegmatis MC2 155]